MPSLSRPALGSQSRTRFAAQALLRRLVPHRHRPRLRRLYGRLTWRCYAGDRVHCPCCDRSFRRFRRFEDEAQCPRCGSLGRHRLIWLYLLAKDQLLRGEVRLLHVGPEHALQQRLSRMPHLTYVSADIDSALADVRIDITDIPYSDCSFDAVLCCHVLEHVRDDRRALRELHRILRLGGWAILQSPIEPELEATFEDPTVTRPRDRARLFGQYDHFRLYGRDYPERLRAAGFVVRVDDYAQGLEHGEALRYGIDRQERVYLGIKQGGGSGGLLPEVEAGLLAEGAARGNRTSRLPASTLSGAPRAA